MPILEMKIEKDDSLKIILHRKLQTLASQAFLKKALESNLAFRALLFCAPFIFLSLFALLFINAEFGARSIGLVISVVSLLVRLTVTAVFLTAVATAIYLTATSKWVLFRRWFFIGKAKRQDRRKAVTNDALVARARFSYNDETEGILLTVLPANKSLSLKQRLLTYVDDRHVNLLGGTRGGKGTSFIIPNLIHHKGSVIVYDPAGENFNATAAYRQQVLGQKVIALDPFNVTGATSHSWNPLLDIDFDTDPQALDKCYALAESLIEITGKDQYWGQSAQQLLAMCCAYIGLRSIPENMHLPQVFDLLQSGDLDPLWIAMSQCEGMCNAVSRYGDANTGREAKEFSGVIQTLRTSLRFLSTSTMRDSLSRSDFSMKDLKNGNTTIYIIVPAGAGSTYKGWLRLLFNCAFDGMQDPSIAKPDIPTLFLIDEFPLLGHMERIKRAAGEAAKFGVKLFLCSQDINQLKEIYGDAWETFVGNSGLTIMFANNDLTTQKYLSEKLGKEYNTRTTTSKDGSSSTQVLEDVARADEVARQTSRASGKAYFLFPDTKPLHLPRATYFDWDMIPEGLEYRPDKFLLEAAE